MNEIILLSIIVIHILFILFIIITPFTNIIPLLLQHAIIVPFMMLHWLTNNNMCALTMAERYARIQLYGECGPHDCFTCKIIEPIYDFTSDKDYMMNIIIYSITIILWLITLYKLYCVYYSGEFNVVFDTLWNYKLKTT